MDSRGFVPGPGKTPPRLINDLLDYDPRPRTRNGKNLLADPAPLFREGVHHEPRTSPSDCRHSLMRKPQTEAPVSDDEHPDDSTRYVVAAYCSQCRYHFQIIANFHQQNGQRAPCCLSDEANPMHHLHLVESIYARDNTTKYGIDKYNMFIEYHRWVCSAPFCPLVLEIQMSPPRLHDAVLSLILSPERVLARGKKIVAEDPVRYAGLGPLTVLQILSNLRTYLSDAKAARDKSELKRIAARNKKFVLAFADECDNLLHYLDFTPITEQDAEGVSNHFWQLPVITPATREFINDVMIELDVLISNRPPEEQWTSKVSVLHVPVPALKDIERSLGYHDYPKRSRTVDLSKQEHPHYASLGVVDDFTDNFLLWAYERQCECDSSNRPYYLDCLRDIAHGRKSSELEMKVAMAASEGEVGLQEVEEAFGFFALDPDTREGDEYIIGVYNSRIESAPRQKDDARKCLRVIAKARNSQKIEAVANDRAMSFEEALAFLNVTEDTQSDSIEAAAVAMAFDADKSRVAAALRVIAHQRGNDFTLQRAAASMESGTGDAALDVGDAYNRLQMPDRNVPDETVLAYYQSLSGGAPAGSKDSYTEALRVIALDRESNFLLRKLDDPNADVQVSRSTIDGPVGLDNIGNTCYLNSLLQFYYTIKPVREVVMNIHSHRMDLDDPKTDEDIRRKRVGGRKVVRSEIIKAQKFVNELHNLFEELRTASTRSVRPTKELAELTIFSSQAEATFRSKSISSPNAPNLSMILNTSAPIYGPEGPPPPVPLRPSPTTAEEDVEMSDQPGEQKSGAGDNGSDTTLVEMGTLPPTPPASYDDVAANADAQPPQSEKASLDEIDLKENIKEDHDTQMVDGDNSTPESAIAMPDKPPPVPPRNKAGLSIQTNTRETISDDDLWRFGSQQDVTEVIGNVVWRMQCAIKASSIEDSTEEQIDDIRDTFFGANAVYTQKSRALERKVEPWANLIVFPPQTGSRDIYEALDVVFDEQIVDIANTVTPQYASINKLPPILQIQIQRTAFDPVRQLPWKNRNPVIFEPTIYLDRYMDSDDPTLMRRRREAWKWKAQLRGLEARQAALKATSINASLPDALAAAKGFVDDLQENKIEDIDVDPTLSVALEDRLREVADELEHISEQITELKQKLSEQFEGMQEYKYDLQTVFIHRGESGGGHYWIYIYDFNSDTWREYNDEYVTEVKDRSRIFDHASQSGGTPYYLAYVRSADKDDLVNAVYRDVKEPAVEMAESTAPLIDLVDEDEGIVMEDNEEDEGDVRHVEYARPRPLLPKLSSQTAASLANWDSPAASEFDAHGNTW